MDGEGVYLWPSGAKYCGIFKNGHWHGVGTYTGSLFGKDHRKLETIEIELSVASESHFARNGGSLMAVHPDREYHGSWVRGVLSGKCCCVWNDGRVYDGEV